MKVCRRCRAAREVGEMASIDEVPYCHPTRRSGESCYEIEARVLAAFWAQTRRKSPVGPR